MKRLLIIIMCALATALRAQTVIEGTVIDSLGTAVDAYITFTTRGGGVIGFADTDAKGHYRATLRSEADSLMITAAGLALGQMTKVVANRSQTVNFRMKAEGLTLKEVKVRAQKITESGDTLNYHVAAYQQQGDRVIGDVLKKMPGIEVEKNGRIKFNGKAITKFYVEDMDLLQGRYGIATNNINAKDVATVQVLQNHQPVRALQGRQLSDDVAINLKLKSSAKGTVAVNTTLTPALSLKGEGELSSPLTGEKTKSPMFGNNVLWGAEAAGMFFAKHRQNMSLYKGNDYGDDVSGELTSHYSSINSVPLAAFCPMSAVMPGGAGLPPKRTFDNRSHIVAVNHLEKIDSVREMTFNAAYHHDLVRREGTSTSDIFLSDDARLLTSETLTSLTTTNNLTTNLRYCKNASGGFIADVLKVDAGWNSDYVDGLLATSVPFSSASSSHSSVPFGSISSGCSIQFVTQHFHRPTLSLSNTFNTIQNFGSRTLDLHFSAGYARRPNTLIVTSTAWETENISEGEGNNNHPSPFRVGMNVNVQTVESHNIATNFHTNFSWKLGYFTLSYGIVADASLHGITTDLQSPTPPLPLEEVAEGGLSNDLWYNTYTLRLAQNYRWEHGRWRLNLGCPVELYAQSLTNNTSPSPSWERAGVRVLLIPTFSASHYYRDWSGNISTGYQRTVGDPGGIYDGYIMSNYRTFQRSYVEQMSQTDRVNCDAHLGYRSAIHAFFFNLAATYAHTRDNQTYDYDYQGATSVVRAIDNATTSDAYTLRGEVSKGFDWLRASVRAFGGYSHSRCERLVGSRLYSFHSRTASIGGGGTITPLPFLNFVISSGYSCTLTPALVMEGEQKAASSSKVVSATQRIKVNVFVTKKMTLSASAEDNYNNLTTTQRHAWFGDLAAKYQFKHVDLELEANNLFNQRTYTQTRYSSLDIYTTTSQLRPCHALLKLRFKLL